ncbi:hypothetical protein BS78_04G103700 [Paspalum vaginatum]|nr:hypothetical protein BS78_04G103700 [Paspalum vaginatum]
MAFLVSTISREMEVQMEKSPPCVGPFLPVNPSSSCLYVSPWASMSTRIFPSGMSNSHGALAPHGACKRGREVVEMKYLFNKVLTQSDVGKLNRLMIPRKYAEKYFLKISETESNGDNSFLTFEDSSTGLVWRFRFNLWRSSKTYVLTKGWPTYTKEKKLKKGDVVSFYRDAWESPGTSRIFIHIKPHVGITSMPKRMTTPVLNPSRLLNDNKVLEGLGFGRSYGVEPAWKPLPIGSLGGMPPTTLKLQPTTSAESISHGNSMGRAKKHLRLFGVDINISPHASGDESSNGFTNDVA